MNEKVTTQEIATSLGEMHGLTKKEAEHFVKSMFELIKEALVSEKYVKVKGLGIFKLTEVDSRESINVNTGERFEIQGHTKISFTPDSSIKEQINKPFSHFETVILNEGVTFEDMAPAESSSSEEVSEPMEANPTPIIDEPTESQPVSSTIEEKKTEILIEETKIESEERTQETNEPVIESPKEELQIIEKPFEDSNERTEVTREPEKSSWALKAIIVALTLVIFIGFYWLFIHEGKNDSSTIIIAEPVKQETVTPRDTISVTAPKDTKPIQEITNSQPVVSPQPVSRPKQAEKVATLSDTLEYEIIGTQATHTLQEGETIIRLALKFYGSKKFWPYIAKHNQNIIKDADRVPVGTTLRIPELKKR